MPLKRAGAGTTQHCSHVCTIQICKLHLTIHLVCRHRENRKCTFSWPLVWNLSKKLDLWEYYTLEFNSKEKRNKSMGLGLYTRKFHSSWKMLCFIFKLFKPFFFLFFFSYPLKRSISKWKWHFEMKHSSSFWKCWYKAFWHFLKPFSFMCACVYEDYLKDETWPYKFILVDRTIQVEVCIKMYFFSF